MLIKGKTKTQIDNEKVACELAQEEQVLLNYLKDTDWYINRFTEASVAVPDAVKSKRNDARLRISEIRILLQSI